MRGDRFRPHLSKRPTPRISDNYGRRGVDAKGDEARTSDEDGGRRVESRRIFAANAT